MKIFKTTKSCPTCKVEVTTESIQNFEGKKAKVIVLKTKEGIEALIFQSQDYYGDVIKKNTQNGEQFVGSGILEIEDGQAIISEDYDNIKRRHKPYSYSRIGKGYYEEPNNIIVDKKFQSLEITTSEAMLIMIEVVQEIRNILIGVPSIS